MASGDLLLKDLESFLENPKDRQTAMFCALHATRTDEDGLLDEFIRWHLQQRRMQKTLRISTKQ